MDIGLYMRERENERYIYIYIYIHTCLEGDRDRERERERVIYTYVYIYIYTYIYTSQNDLIQIHVLQGLARNVDRSSFMVDFRPALVVFRPALKTSLDFGSPLFIGSKYGPQLSALCFCLSWAGLQYGP